MAYEIPDFPTVSDGKRETVWWPRRACFCGNSWWDCKRRSCGSFLVGIRFIREKIKSGAKKKPQWEFDGELSLTNVAVGFGPSPLPEPGTLCPHCKLPLEPRQLISRRPDVYGSPWLHRQCFNAESPVCPVENRVCGDA